MTQEVVLKTENLTKSFPGVLALDDVSIDLYKGEVHALLGENGAGKSTLIKILSGAYPHSTYNGSIIVNNKKVFLRNTQDAFKFGISTIYQELMLCNELDIGENVFLGEKPKTKIKTVNWPKIYSETSKLLQMFNLKLSPKLIVSKLSIAHKQVIEILKAMRMNSEIIILDEPTAALAENEVELLFDIMNQLKNRGYSLIFVSHKLDEVQEIADRVTILRDGKLVYKDRLEKLNHNSMIELMIGRELSNMYPKEPANIGQSIYEVQNFSVKDPLNPTKFFVEEVNFSVRKGEIVGIAGLIGSGRQKILSGLFGVYMPDLVSGDVFLNGEKIEIGHPKNLIEKGIGFISENRKEMGLVLSMDVSSNITLASLKAISKLDIINTNLERQFVKDHVDALNIKTYNFQQLVDNLSGGNQQKVVIAKWLMTKPTVLLLNEPTRGIDVGAKVEIYKILNKLAKSGVGILMSSSELPELIGITDRILILYDGRINKEFFRKDYDEHAIMQHITRIA